MTTGDAFHREIDLAITADNARVESMSLENGELRLVLRASVRHTDILDAAPASPLTAAPAPAPAEAPVPEAGPSPVIQPPRPPERPFQPKLFDGPPRELPASCVPAGPVAAPNLPELSALLEATPVLPSRAIVGAPGTEPGFTLDTDEPLEAEDRTAIEPTVDMPQPEGAREIDEPAEAELMHDDDEDEEALSLDELEFEDDAEIPVVEDESGEEPLVLEPEAGGEADEDAGISVAEDESGEEPLVLEPEPDDEAGEAASRHGEPQPEDEWSAVIDSGDETDDEDLDLDAHHLPEDTSDDIVLPDEERDALREARKAGTGGPNETALMTDRTPEPIGPMGDDSETSKGDTVLAGPKPEPPPESPRGQGGRRASEIIRRREKENTMIRFVCPKCKTPGVQPTNKLGSIITCKCGKAMRLTLKR